MTDLDLGEMELRFATLIWERAPIASGELVKLAESELSWKKSTTYTMLRRLIERGIFENRDSTVTVKITREQFDARRSERFVRENFRGSLPAFLAAFTSRKRLSEREISELEAILEKCRRE